MNLLLDFTTPVATEISPGIFFSIKLLLLTTLGGKTASRWLLSLATELRAGLDSRTYNQRWRTSKSILTAFSIQMPSSGWQSIYNILRIPVVSKVPKNLLWTSFICSLMWDMSTMSVTNTNLFLAKEECYFLVSGMMLSTQTLGRHYLVSLDVRHCNMKEMRNRNVCFVGVHWTWIDKTPSNGLLDMKNHLPLKSTINSNSIQSTTVEYKYNPNTDILDDDKIFTVTYGKIRLHSVIQP